MLYRKDAAYLVHRIILFLLILSFPIPSQGADIVKGNNNTALDQANSWVGGVVPGTNDVAQWDLTITSQSKVNLGADLSWKGIKVVKPTGTTIIYPTNTLTLGSSGIDMSSSDQRDLTVNCQISLGASQAWNIASGRLLKMAIISGPGGFEKTGAGDVQFNATDSSNSYAGDTTITTGKLWIAGGAEEQIPNGAGKGNLIVNGTLELRGGGDETVNGLWGSGTINKTTSSGTRNLYIGDNYQSSTFSGTISDYASSGSYLNIVKTGFSTLELTGTNSTYAGKTTIIFGGIKAKKLSDSGMPSSIGASTGANAVVSLGSYVFGGWLAYTGTGDKTDRPIDLSGTTGGGALEGSGTGPIVFTANFTATGAGVKNLWLTGTNEDTNTVAGAIVNGSGTNVVSLLKDGAGRWVLCGASTYTGATSITNGTLVINGSLASGSAVTVTNKGVLAGTGTVNGTLSVNSGGKISPADTNSIGTLHTGSETWNKGGRLNFEINNATGTAGINYDQLSVLGSGNINIQATSDNPFSIYIASLNSSSPGEAANFNNESNYTWTIATAGTGGVTNFSASKFSINTNQFLNHVGKGYFTVEQSENALQLIYKAEAVGPVFSCE